VSGDAPDPVADRPATAAPPPPPADAADSPGAPGGDADRGAGGKPGQPSRPIRPVCVKLEVSRNRSISWAIFDLILGALLIRGLGTVGVWVGFVLVAIGLYHAARLIQTLIYPPGTIVVSDREISLPRGLCKPRPVTASPKDITAIYFLRRSVPWNHTAPVLVIELGARAMTFPRDWFASEAEQRHVIHAVQRAKGETPQTSASSAPDAA
jgi:hypothetical protein